MKIGVMQGQGVKKTESEGVTEVELGALLNIQIAVGVIYLAETITDLQERRFRGGLLKPDHHRGENVVVKGKAGTSQLEVR